MRIGCRDQCGAGFESDTAPGDWDYLSLTKSYRCPACRKALNAVKGNIGPQGQTQDTLDKDSLGALPDLKGKVPAPVAVKG